MMPNNEPQLDAQTTLNQIKELISKKSSGVIVVSQKPTEDALSAATALYMGLSKLGKQVNLVCSELPKSNIQGVDKFDVSLESGGDSLVVSFPYKEGSIDKVDYNIANDKFNLVIIPRQGFSKMNPQDVEFSYTGGRVEFIICVDVPNLNNLGPIFQKNQRQFESSSIINIDRHLINNNFGMINYVVKNSSSTSELILQLLFVLKVELDKTMATNLYAGIASATNMFTSFSTNSDTFLALSHLLKMGAVKKMPIQNQIRTGQNPGFMGGAPFGTNPFQNQFVNRIGSNNNPSPQGFQQIDPIEKIESESQKQQNKESFIANDSNDNVNDQDEQNSLKPRIFSGNGGLV